MADSLRIGRALHGTLASALPVRDSLDVQSRRRVVLRKHCRFGLHRHRKPFLEYLGNLLMNLLPGAVQQRLIRYLLGEDVLEGIGLFWNQAGLIEEFGSLQVPETASEGILGYLRDSLQKGNRNLRPDHGGCL